MPVTMPAAGASPPYRPSAASALSSRNGAPGSSRRAMRSRASSLSRARVFTRMSCIRDDIIKVISLDISERGLHMPAQTVRTTLTLPVELLEAADRAVRTGRARSRNELVARALRHELAALERAAIDT